MYIFGHISVKQRQLPDQRVDSGPWVVQLCENNSGLKSSYWWHFTPSHVWSSMKPNYFQAFFCKIVFFAKKLWANPII